jgi:antitoxin MazE
MTTTVVKWGNSQGIRLSKALLQNVNIAENDRVDVLVENETILIKKNYGRTHRTTKERLMDFYGRNTKNDTEQQEEIDWGKSMGKEVW